LARKFCNGEEAGAKEISLSSGGEKREEGGGREETHVDDGIVSGERTRVSSGRIEKRRVEGGQDRLTSNSTKRRAKCSSQVHGRSGVEPQASRDAP